MSEGAQAQGLIGPNAVLQLLPEIERQGGPSRVARMLVAAGMTEPPDGTSMIPEVHAARLHQMLRRVDPIRAPAILAAAGRSTAHYILQHRIPKVAQYVLRAAPPRLASAMLSRAIETHAWTFAGSGLFRRMDAWTFRLQNNPMVRGELSDAPLCLWHAAVFEELYRALVHPECTCVETACCAQSPSGPCTFQLTIRP